MKNLSRKIRKLGIIKTICVMLCIMAFYFLSLAADLASFRLLSLSESEKLILVSQIPGKKKFLLDASSAKITIDGKPAEYKALKAFSMVQLKMEARKLSKLGIDLDGVATEIRVSSPEKAK
ncbi:MAG TPA: hypothetical protein VMG30_09960 [Acidobacteriota bacterium]|nr:hypothetical protein [Acidobacteriota bacterium]